MKKASKIGSISGVYKLSPADLRICRLILAVLFFALLFFPTLNFFLLGIRDFDAESLTRPFWYILSRSFFSATLQALLSTLFSLLLGLFWALCFIDVRSSALERFLGLMNPFSFLIFSMPTTTLALLVLDFNRSVDLDIGPGLIPIVICHVFMNALYVGTRLRLKLKSFLESSGRDLVAAAQTLGATASSVFRTLLWSQIFPELRSLGLLVFLWSFSAVSSVLILGGGPRFSTPEVLLYYSLLGEGLGSRVFLLGLFQAALFMLVAKFSLKQLNQGSLDYQPAPSLFKMSSLNFPILKLRRVLGLLLCSLFLLPFASLWLPLLKSSEILPRLMQMDFFDSFLATLVLAVLTFLMSFFLFLCLLGAKAEDRKKVALGMGFSSALLGALWLALGLDVFTADSRVLQMCLGALALSILQIPVAAYWIESERSLELETQESVARTLGAGAWSIFLKLRIPFHSELLFRLALSSMALSLGELLVTGLFLRDFNLLSSLARNLSAKYRFEEAAYLNAVMALVFVLSFFLLSKRRKILNA